MYLVSLPFSLPPSFPHSITHWFSASYHWIVSAWAILTTLLLLCYNIKIPLKRNDLENLTHVQLTPPSFTGLKTNTKNIGQCQKRLEDVLNVTNFCLPKPIQGVLKTSWRHIARQIKTNLCLGFVLQDKSKSNLKCAWSGVFFQAFRHLKLDIAIILYIELHFNAYYIFKSIKSK